MKTRAEKLARMDAILAAADAEKRDMTAEEQAEFDTLRAEIDALDAETNAANAMQARRDEVAARRSAPQAATPAVASNPTPANAGGRQVPMRGPEVKEFASLAEFCTAAVFNPRDQRLAALFRSRGNTQDDGMHAEQRMDTGQAGGFLVPQQFRSEILRVSAPNALVRPRATVIPAGSPPDAEITFPALDQTGAGTSNVFGGVEVKWVAEGGPKPETDADFREVSLKPNEVTGHIKLTDKLLRNAPAAGAFIASLLPAAIASAEDFAFISGNGIGKPEGFQTSAARYIVSRNNANQVTFDDIVQMLSRLLSNGGSPVWVASRSLLPIISQIQDNSGGTGVGAYIFVKGDMQAGIPDSLFGYPIVWSERTPALGSRGDLSLVDLSMYLVKDGSGPFIAYSEHVEFLNNKTVVKIFSNVDGKAWLTAPFVGQDGRKTSPFVLLGANGEAETA